MSRFGFVACASVAALATGCGGGGREDAAAEQLSGSDDATATKVAQRYVDAYTRNDARAVCELLAVQVRDSITSDSGGGCMGTVRASFSTGYNPKLRAVRAYVQGEMATVTFRDSPRRVRLIREGGTWRVIDGGT